MRSKWLEGASNPDVSYEECVSAQSQPCTSGRPQGTRWFNVVQGIRRSLDVHLKSYYKIDNAYSSTHRLSSSSAKLKALTRALTDTGLVDFCCVYLVHPARGTFGVVALSGAGVELFPPLLGDEEAHKAVRLGESSSQSLLNVFTRCVFQVKDSNWCVEDVVASRAPWYYDCASAVNGFGLPQDGGWLRRVGMRSVLALPCMQGNDVTGVLAVASKQKSLEHLLLHKLEELCYKITPIVTDAVVEYSALLCNRRIASRYESISDFAHEVLGELLNLDRAVAASVSGIRRCSANVSHQVGGQAQKESASGSSSSSKGRNKPAADERSVFDVMSAVAAAAAAGFSWTAPAAPPLELAARAEQERSSEQSARGMETFCTALADDVAYSVVLTADLSMPLLHDGLPSPVSEEVLKPAVPASRPLPLLPVSESLVASGLAGPDNSPPPNGLCRAPCVGTSKSLPDHTTPEGAEARAAATDYLRCTDAALRHVPPSQPHLRQQPAAAGLPSVVLLSGGRNASRSTRSLSCLEFSGGIADAQEELASGSENMSSSTNQAPVAFAAVAAAAAAAAKCACSTAAAVVEPALKCKAMVGNMEIEADTKPRCLRSPPRCNAITISGTARDMPSGQNTPGMVSHRTSASGDKYMMASRSTEELAAVLQHGHFAGSVMTSSPSVWSSRNMESRVMQRGLPLEASVGAIGSSSCGVAAAAAAGVTNTDGRSPRSTVATSLPPVSSLPPAQTVPPKPMDFSTARGSSCATDCCSTLAADTVTTYGYTNCSHDISSLYGGNAARLSDAWDSQCGGAFSTNVTDFGGVRTSLHGGARGRWSRDSAAAAAAVWSNETAEAVAAAMRFTAIQEIEGEAAAASRSIFYANGGDAETFWTARAHRSAATSSAPPPAPRSTYMGDAAAAFGGLYGIQESGAMPSSLEFSDSDDGAIAVLGMPSGGSNGAGAAFLLSSGLGAEAMWRQQREHPGIGNEATRDDLSSLAHPPACEKAGFLVAVPESLAVRA